MHSGIRRGCGRPVLALALAAGALAACASSQGDAFMRQRSFADAEAAYDRELAAAPNDQDVKAKRDAARAEVIRGKLEQGRAMRTAGHGDASLTVLVEALGLETRWKLTLPSDVAGMREEEIAAAGEVLASVTRPALAARAPLAARQRVARVLALLSTAPRLGLVRAKAEADIAAAGKAKCSELAAAEAARGPYFARLLASYCAPFGVEVALPSAPEQRRGLRVSGRVDNTSDTQHRTLESWVASAFQRSPWYAAESVAMTPLAFSGRYDAKLESKRVTVTAPYTVIEHSTVHRPLKAPLRVETRSERSFAYEMERFEARYHLDATLNLQLADPSPPLVVRVDWAEKRKAYQHDVSFPPAGVHPRKANLPTVNTWLAMRLTRKRDALLKKLEGRWEQAFCAGPKFELEEGARCLYGNGKRTTAALAAVTAVLGQDTEAAIDQMLRRRIERPSPEAVADDGKKAAAEDEPAVEEATPVSSESI